MRPYFVVRNSLFGLAGGLDRKDRRATATFEALPGQDCAEGVVVALPKCDNATSYAHHNATGKPAEVKAEAEAEAGPGESHHDDSSEANGPITVPAVAKVQLVQGEGGSLCLSFSLNDGTDLNIFDSNSTGTTSNDGDIRPSSSTVFRIARAAYPHLLHFSRLTNHETHFPNKPNDIYDDRNNCNPSASQYISVDSKYMEVLNSSTVAVSVAVSTEPVRNARIYDNISFADLHGMVRQVQKQIPAARPDDGCLNLSQFLAFSCLLDQHVAYERDAAPRLSVRILKRNDHSLRIVVSSSNKACRITAKAHPRECAGTNHSAEASIGIAKEQEGILELGSLEENTEYSINIVGYCPLSKISAQATFICRTKEDAEPKKMYPSWSDMSREDQETELLAIVKDRAIRNLAAMEGIATDLTKSMSDDESQVDLTSSFALWWSQNERAREDFCLREAKQASKDPAIRQSAENEGIIIKSRDWEASTTDVAALCRRRSFCWWYYEMQPAKRVGAAIHRHHRDQGKEDETHTAHCKVPITPSFLPFSPPPLSRPKEEGPEKSTTKPTLPKYPQTQYKEKHQTLQPDNVFVVTNRSDGAAWGRPEDECNGDDSSEKERHACGNHSVEDALHTEISSTGSNEIGLSDEHIPTPLQQDLASTSINSAESNATSTKDTNLSQPEVKKSAVVDDASAKPQGDRLTSSAKKAGIPETTPRLTHVPAIYRTGTVVTSAPTRKPPSHSKRSTFLGAQTAKAKKAVGEVDEMLSFQMNAKNLKGVALLKAKVRLVMITARLQALREKSGCKDDAPALDHVNLFDEDDTEQSSQQQRIEIDAPSLPISANKESTTTPPPSISDTSSKDSHTKNTEDRSLALANVTDIYKRSASRGVKGSYQAWKLNAEEQKKSEAYHLEGNNAPVDDSLADETSVSSTSLKREEDAFDASDSSSSSSSLAPGASIEPSDSSLDVNSLPIHACAESPQQPTERFDEIFPTASEDVDNRTVCPCRKFCMSLDEDMDNDNCITDTSEYFVQNTNILNLLSAMAYPNGSGTRISKQEYETEYRDYIENSSTPLADLGPRFVRSI